MNLHTAVDTSGQAPFEAFEEIYGLVDLFLYDVKILDREAHRKYVGLPNDLILENLSRLAGKGNKACVRIPIIPGFTDTDDNIAAALKFLQALDKISKVSLLPYNRLHEDKYERFQITPSMKPPPDLSPDKLHRIGARFEAQGYQVSIGG
jgi:pyruvate formate lyase activating enzyme